MKQIFLDTETTGLGQNNAVIQIAGSIWINEEKKKEFNIQAQPYPTDRIDEAAMRVHGITEKDLSSYQGPLEAYKEFISTLDPFIDRYNKKDKLWMLGFNIGFDERMLRSWFTKAGDKFFGSWFHWPAIDVAQIFAALCMENLVEKPDRMKLISCCEAMGLGWDEEEAHDALYDINKTKELFDACIDLKKGA